MNFDLNTNTAVLSSLFSNIASVAALKKGKKIGLSTKFKRIINVYCLESCKIPCLDTDSFSWGDYKITWGDKEQYFQYVGNIYGFVNLFSEFWTNEENILNYEKFLDENKISSRKTAS